jgi:hypothetical protein
VPSPRYFFRLPQHQADELEALAVRTGTAPGLIVKLLVSRTLSEVATILEDHDLQLEHIYLAIRDIAQVHRELMTEHIVATDDHSKRILDKLDELARAVDSIRDSAFVRPSTTIQDLIAAHDEKPIQQSLQII